MTLKGTHVPSSTGNVPAAILHLKGSPTRPPTAASTDSETLRMHELAQRHLSTQADCNRLKARWVSTEPRKPPRRATADGGPGSGLVLLLLVRGLGADSQHLPRSRRRTASPARSGASAQGASMR